MIYLPENEITAFGGVDKVGDNESFNALKQKVLSPSFSVDTKPVKICGSMSYVEQTSWIQNKTIKDNILFGSQFDADKYE